MNIEFEFVKKIIYNFKSLEHRMEKINSNPLIINDSKSTNLHSCKAAVNSFDENMILILGGYSNEKIEKDEIISIVNKKTIKRIICYGEIGETIYEIIKNYKKSKYINNFKEAIFESLDKSGDRRACKIFKMRYIIGDKNKVMPWKKVSKEVNLSIQGCINIHNSYIKKIKSQKIN